MFALVHAWRESGLSRSAFCERHKLKVTTFAYWVTRKNKADQSEGGFLPVEVSGVDAKASQVQIHYPNGLRVSLACGDVSVIHALIRLYDSCSA